MILTRILKIDGMVVYSLLIPALSLSICLSSYSIQIVCNQNVSENPGRPIRNILKSAAKINIITSSLVSLAILCLFPFYKRMYGNPLVYYPLLTIIPLIFFSNFSGILKGYSEAKKDFTTPGISNLLEQCAKIALSVFFLYMARDKDVYTKVFVAFLAMSLSEIVSFTYLIFKIKKRTKINWFRTTDDYKKQILKQATPLTLEHFIIGIVSFIEPIVFYLGAELAGFTKESATLIYAITNQYAIPLLIIAAFISTTLAKTLFPYIAQSRGNLAPVKSRIDIALLITLAISILNFNICYFHSEIALKFLYNDTSAKPVVQLLSFAFFFSYYSPIFVSMLQASKCEIYLFIESIVINLLSLALMVGLLFIPSIGIYAYPLALAVSSLLKNICHTIYIAVKLKYKISLKGFLLVFAVLLSNIALTKKLNFQPYVDFALANLLSLSLIAFYYFYFHSNKGLRYHKKHK